MLNSLHLTHVSGLSEGLHTAPNYFQLLVDKVLHGLKFRVTLCYLNDVRVCSDIFNQHMLALQEVFKRFRDAGLK